MIENTAFKLFEVWWDEKKSKKTQTQGSGDNIIVNNTTKEDVKPHAKHTNHVNECRPIPSFHNELGNADELVNHQPNGKMSLLLNWRTKKSLNLLNITYDVTPADLVTAVITELAILPCTSVPVTLRIKPSEI
ncbi:translation initiation factor eIF2B subunit delta-like [Temnothorax nylanderi]|uniref:translation initiation factor eIF2B subunit delta-like n=1 Tax=Temnothorax nylanderi TaxID=102681 RepID=UPI003A86ED1C